MSEAWSPDDRPEPDEFELVYGDLKLAQAEIERLKEENSAVENQVVEYAGQLLEDAKEIAKLKKLITELAAALKWWREDAYDETSDFRESVARSHEKLELQARKATKDESI